MQGKKEKRFLDTLETLFTGAEVDGDSGFVNLMRMKRAYFQSIRSKLMEEIDKRARKDTSFREELFDKLYTFFNRYFCESGSIYFRHLPAFAKIYDRVYADGQDVALSWKTQMLYYVKSDVLVRSMPIELNEKDQPQNTRRFYFDASEFEHKQNNERREFVFAFDSVQKTKKGRVVHLKVSYSKGATKTKPKEILKQSREAGISLSEENLQKAIGVFKRQTEADYFINKDAKGFLREQFDLWLYQYMFNEETIFEQNRLSQLQAIQQTAYNIIDFISQFEDELRRAWEKPKFVRNVNYVVTLDKLSDAILAKISTHKGAKSQIKEWQELRMIDNKFSMKTLFKGQKAIDDKNGVTGDYKFLPLDTKHFKDLEVDILACLGNLDEVLDGELVHSENWQALNTLQRRYKEKVKCIYIDPPYNTSASEIVYKNSYKHSSFLCLLENRMSMSKFFLTKEGIIEIAIDDEEFAYINLVTNFIFDSSNRVGIIAIMSNPRGRSDDKHLAAAHDYLILHASNINFLETSQLLQSKESLLKKYNKQDEIGFYRELPLRRSGSNSKRDDRPNLYYPFFLDPKTMELSLHQKRNAKQIAILPIDTSGTERVWRWGKENASQKLLTDIIVKRVGDDFLIYGKDRLKKEIKPKSLWVDPHYDASSHGTVLLNHLFGCKEFDYPKSIHTVQDSVKIGSDQSSTILDYFAGSGTTAHAVINLNREDGGNRKYLLIEMGEYFHTVLLPRIKKVVYSKDWRDGNPVSREGVSHCLKYYTLEQYEETLRNSHYEDGKQLQLDSAKSPFEQYVFFGDDKLAHTVKPLKNGNLKINLQNLYKDIDIAESLSNILGKPIRKRTVDSVTFADNSTEKTNPKTMTEKEKQHFISLIKPYLWWGE